MTICISVSMADNHVCHLCCLGTVTQKYFFETDRKNAVTFHGNDIDDMT